MVSKNQIDSFYILFIILCLLNSKILWFTQLITYYFIGLVYPGLGVKIELKRHLGFHLTQSYMPSTMFVIVGWISFMVPSDAIPGRMVVCVTTLLTLTSMFDSVR